MIEVITLNETWPAHATALAQNVFTLLINETFVEDDETAALALSDNAHLHTLNKQFRQINAPTNVLSFPSDADDFLGDIAISFEKIVTEAKEQEKTFDDHFTHMILHGLLHLLGYDHMNKFEASEMEALEIGLLAKLGIENPYE